MIIIKIISEGKVENSRAAEMSQPLVNLLSSSQSLPRHLKLGHQVGWSVGEFVMTRVWCLGLPAYHTSRVTTDLGTVLY